MAKYFDPFTLSLIVAVAVAVPILGLLLMQWLF
jgi:hypothetical protein